MSTTPLDQFTNQAQQYLANMALKDIYDLTRRFIDLNFQRQGYHSATGFTKWKPVTKKKDGFHLVNIFSFSY